MRFKRVILLVTGVLLAGVPFYGLIFPSALKPPIESILIKGIVLLVLASIAILMSEEPLPRARSRLSNFTTNLEELLTKVQYLRWIGLSCVFFALAYSLLVMGDIQSERHFPSHAAAIAANVLFILGLVLFWFRFAIAQKLTPHR
jgi:hypothetical protein